MTEHPTRKEAEKALAARYAELADFDRNDRLTPRERREYARHTLTAAGVLAATWDKEEKCFDYSITPEGYEFFEQMRERGKSYDYYE